MEIRSQVPETIKILKQMAAILEMITPGSKEQYDADLQASATEDRDAALFLYPVGFIADRSARYVENAYNEWKEGEHDDWKVRVCPYLTMIVTRPCTSANRNELLSCGAHGYRSYGYFPVGVHYCVGIFS
ncbi:hypothetical protein I7I51_06152 [Histoplasma capsulatum]|uniref:Uncharacterized protein n=1 Tax=Ajellomyces capsulatus TaxID=5037 RepID=A0A8A1MJK7_AJECA|nr:hypothetical protein I7I51_06152 [Histoplasma capsulatum]